MMKWSDFNSVMRVRAEQLELYSKSMRLLQKYSEETAPEIFRWLGWATAIAALRVVWIRAEASKIALFIVVSLLSLVLLARIQWFFGMLVPKESISEDGHVEVRFNRVGRRAGFLIAWVLTYLIVVFLSSAITRSELLPPVKEAKNAVSGTK